MTIAFVSYEYPPETGGGGIGTYLFQCVKWLPAYGHEIVVFCATAASEAFWENEFVYRIPASDWDSFNRILPTYFTQVHKERKFDIAEGTDFRAGGIEIMKIFPDLPFVVKAHSANYIVDKYLFRPISGWQKIRFALGALKQGRLPSFPKPPAPEQYPREKEILQKCDQVISPSMSLGDMYVQLGWAKDYALVPYLFHPSASVLKISPLKEKIKLDIVFYGRLEMRKGVVTLAKSIPFVIQKYKNVHFHFIGNPSNSPQYGVPMDQYLENKLKKYKKYVTIRKAVPPEQVPEILEMGDIFVFPSLYDSFGLVCCEAMAAGKAVIGSKSGGMAEIIEEGVSGLLVTPKNVLELASKIMDLIARPEKRILLGQQGRKRIRELYHPDVIIPQQIELYEKVVRHKIQAQ